MEYWQTITILSTTTLADVLALFLKEFAKENMMEEARYKWNEAKYDPANEAFGDLLINLKTTVKQAFDNDVENCIKMFFFGKLPD